MLSRIGFLSLLFYVCIVIAAESIDVTPKDVVLIGNGGYELTFFSHQEYLDFVAKLCPRGCTCNVDKAEDSASLSVNCNDRNLTDIPKIDKDLTVAKLDVGRNEISVLKSGVFDSYSSIEVFWAFINEIETIDVNTFSGLKNLKEVDLSDNLIFYIDPDTFKNNENLQTVILSGNSLVQVSGNAPILNAPLLTELDISFCKLASLTTESFRNLQSLQTLDISSNDLRSLSTDTLKQIVGLKSVDLSNNRWSCDCNLTLLLSWTAKIQQQNGVPLHKPVRCISPQGGARKLWSVSSGGDSDCTEQAEVLIQKLDCNSLPMRDTIDCNNKINENLSSTTIEIETTEKNELTIVAEEAATVFGNLMSFFEENSEIIFVILLIIVVFTLTVLFAYLCVKRVMRSNVGESEENNKKSNLTLAFGDGFSNKRYSSAPLLGPSSPDVSCPTNVTDSRRLHNDQPPSLYQEYIRTRPRSEHVYEIVR